MNKICAVYKIVNTITGDFYIGSSKNVLQRWACHKCPSRWKEHPNALLYKALQKFGLENFRFQILCPVEPEYLKQVEQELIEMLHPTYNCMYAKGLDVERRRKWCKTEKGKESQKKYHQSKKGKESNRESVKKYRNRLCSYNGETLTLNTLAARFRRSGIKHPVIEAKKYLIQASNSKKH